MLGAVQSVSCALCFRWGGCVVALTTKDTVNDYIGTLQEDFYKGNPAAFGKDLDSLVFATEPNVGAEIYEMKQ
jgi:N-acetylgalactosamine kinase